MKTKLSFWIILWMGAALLFFPSCSDNNAPAEPETPPVIENPDEDDNTDLPPIDFSHDYTQAPIGASPSVVKYTQTLSTVNGKPFLPLMLYGVETADMPQVKKYGFNVVHTYHTRDAGKKESDWLAYMDAAQKNGLMVFFNLDGATLNADKEAKIKQMVKCVKNHPALFCWYLADEPTTKNIAPATLKSMYSWIKSEDPNHPIVCSNWELGNFMECCDADMRQLYNGLPSRQTEPLDNYLEKQNNHKKTWIAILNAHDRGWGYEIEHPANPSQVFGKLADAGYKAGDPEWETEKARWQPFLNDLEHPERYGFTLSPAFPQTAEEVRGSLYWALLHGSNGLAYWLYCDPSTLNLRYGWYTTFHQTLTRESIQKTFKEFGELSKYLINPAEYTNSFMTPQGIFVWSRQIGKRRMVVMLNETGDDFNKPIDLAKLYLTDGRLRIYNEDNRLIRMQGDQFTDSFTKESVHVYFTE